MPEPPLRRTPASEFEVKIAAGAPDAVEQLVVFLGPLLHRHLSLEFSLLLNTEDRDDLMMRFIVDLIKGKVKYDYRLASLESFAKMHVFRRAVDLLRKRGRDQERDRSHGTATLLRLSNGSPLDDMEFAELVERAKVAIAAMPENYKAAVEARWRYGRDGYKAALVREFGVSPSVAAQWLRRGMLRLSDATGLAARQD
jgi:RNA polymerase sigma factor (sigma-70 family)